MTREEKLDVLFKQIKKFKITPNSFEDIYALHKPLTEINILMDVSFLGDSDSEFHAHVDNYARSIIVNCIKLCTEIYHSREEENKALRQIMRGLKYSITLFRSCCISS